MSKLKSVACAIFVCGMAAESHAATFSDPTWPCIQRKVDTLSVALMWPHPVEADATVADAGLQNDINDLADSLALRRIKLETLEPNIEAFAAKHGGDAKNFGLVFQRVFHALSKRRTRIISGIGDFSASQIALAKQIDDSRMEMDVLMGAEQPDYDKVDVVEERIDWDQIIYTDRQRSITYLCETPLLIEKRLFAIAKMLLVGVRD